MVDPTVPTHLGNVWMIAASMVLSIVQHEPGKPCILTIDSDGAMEAVGPQHPEYEQRLTTPGFVCGIGNTTPVERLAARLREAAIVMGDKT